MNPIWSPKQDLTSKTNLYQFMQYCQENHNAPIDSYQSFHRWSVESIDQFWLSFWNYAGIVSKSPVSNVKDNSPMPFTKWFPGTQINFAENLLRFKDSKIAIVSYGERGKLSEISYQELYHKVGAVAKFLRGIGIQKGDRVAGYMPNIPETIIAMLATTSIGAIWTSTSPDFGVGGVLDRFSQIEPNFLFTVDGYTYKEKPIELLSKVEEIRSSLQSLKGICIISFIGSKLTGDYILWNEISKEIIEPIFEPITFQDPVYIMYSSGTTGLPKCIVQGPGVLLNQTKEHILHVDLKRKDTIFYFTTCGWMMWNWLSAALFTGATLVLFDGNPFHPGPETLWKMSEELEITVFGTSAKYLSILESTNFRPIERYPLTKLKAILSTGSPLAPDSFDYVYQSIKKDVQLSSISGGTDLNSCFVLGNPILPVYKGEIQCIGLGMAVEVWNDNKESVIQEKGELVCTKPFPSMPLYFWNDVDHQKYLSAYFEKYPGIWRHGDFIEITERGGIVIYGRSDATLNPGGVRIGTAEIYRATETIPEIKDSLVVGREKDNDVQVLLFIVLTDGVVLDSTLEKKIKDIIRAACTPRHVPDKIFSVLDIPYTLNLKKVELAVKNVLEGKPVKNKDSLVNPESLKYFEVYK